MPKLSEYEAKELPFDNELAGISKRTIEIHHDKLYAGYVAKMKEIGIELAKFAKGETKLTGNQTYSELRSLRSGETFATNGVYLHEYYFEALGGDGSIPDNLLTQAIVEKWGSIESFINFFTESGMAMRGWVVLAWDVQLSRLKVYGCDSHDSGAVWGCLPILVLDVYEHAYFIDYGSDRKAYIADFFKNLDWERVNSLYEKWSNISR
ncbi:MAG: Fe-Mn family superoxide dismutase [Candidatus Uhrbacteria bacterium]|nr:Fe-Mn family superoxide dismutase [Candidatus Uhrbacteria bacterium]